MSRILQKVIISAAMLPIMVMPCSLAQDQKKELSATITTQRKIVYKNETIELNLAIKSTASALASISNW